MVTRVRAGEDPVTAAHRIWADRPFGGIVRQADTLVVEEADEGSLALKHVADRSDHGGIGRELGANGT